MALLFKLKGLKTKPHSQCKSKVIPCRTFEMICNVHTYLANQKVILLQIENSQVATTLKF
jgi:hypothetical protein